MGDRGAPDTSHVHGLVRSSDSRSLWNVTASPGWSKRDVAALCRGIVRHGMGHWRTILRDGELAGKTAAQLNLQAQRLIGQQSLAEFMGLHVDVRLIFERNTGIEGVRKQGGILINTGDKETREERKAKIRENIDLFEVPEEDRLTFIDREFPLDVQSDSGTPQRTEDTGMTERLEAERELESRRHALRVRQSQIRSLERRLTNMNSKLGLDPSETRSRRELVESGAAGTTEEDDEEVSDPDFEVAALEIQGTKWIQCDLCSKWRIVSEHCAAPAGNERWTCTMNQWDPKHNKCSAPEERWDEADALPRRLLGRSFTEPISRKRQKT